MASTTYNPGAREERKGNQATEKIKEAGTEALDKVKQTGTDVMGKAKETVSSVGEMATQGVAAAGQKADVLAAAAGHGLREFGGTFAGRLPQEGIAGRASQAVADTIKEGGRYIEEHKLSGMAQDLETEIKNHLIPALFVVFGIGFCLGRTIRD